MRFRLKEKIHLVSLTASLKSNLCSHTIIVIALLHFCPRHELSIPFLCEYTSWYSHVFLVITFFSLLFLCHYKICLHCHVYYLLNSFILLLLLQHRKKVLQWKSHWSWWITDTLFWQSPLFYLKKHATSMSVENLFYSFILLLLLDFEDTNEWYIVTR